MRPYWNQGSSLASLKNNECTYLAVRFVLSKFFLLIILKYLKYSQTQKHRAKIKFRGWGIHTYTEGVTVSNNNEEEDRWLANIYKKEKFLSIDAEITWYFQEHNCEKHVNPFHY